MASGDGLRNALADMGTCLRFFSRLPLPKTLAADRPFGAAIRWLPVAGLVIGACGALPMAAVAALGAPSGAAAIVAVAAGTLATGGLHEDGLADTADGFGGGASRFRKLEIMRDSRIGTYGVLALGLSLLWRVAALAALIDRAGTGAAATALLAAAAVSRGLALLPLATLPPAREDGLGRAVGALDRGALAACLGAAAAIGAALPASEGIGIGHTLLACGLAALAAAGVTRLAGRQIGGHTGDVAGACQQAAEAAYLFGLILLPPLGR